MVARAHGRETSYFDLAEKKQSLFAKEPIGKINLGDLFIFSVDTVFIGGIIWKLFLS